MKEKPILFSTPMVRAILEGRKTMTRRVFKNPMKKYVGYRNRVAELLDDAREDLSEKEFYEVYSPYSNGDKLWVRETFTKAPNGEYIYRADPTLDYCGEDDVGWDWTPSIFMPRKASRITLEVKRVKVERLQDITEEDARAEGCLAALNSSRVCFRSLWETLNAKRGYPWDSNPWVYGIEFVSNGGNQK
ncbi:hypothetical protein Holit_02862 [Hollandina sp. SP2]